MQKHNNTIEHEGEILTIEGQKVKVRILSKSACSTCHAKSICGTGDSKEKIIDVHLPSQIHSYKVGDNVIVGITRKMGTHAVLLGFVLPLLIMVGFAILMLLRGCSEALAAGVALGAVALYYAVIYLLRNKIEKQFSFHLRPAFSSSTHPSQS